MSTFKYVTAYWRDSHEVYGQGISAYTGTTFFVLNPNAVRAEIKIHFHDLKGNLYPDMEVNMILPENSVLDMRIVDIIAFKNPAYRTTTNLRTGWLKVISDVPLAISGKMYSGRSTALGTNDENVWSIPFEEIKVVEIDLEEIRRTPTIPNNEIGEYFKKYRRPL